MSNALQIILPVVFYLGLIYMTTSRLPATRVALPPPLLGLPTLWRGLVGEYTIRHGVEHVGALHAVSSA